METLKCPKCGENLIMLNWSKDKIIQICNNGNCLAYRNPLSNCSYYNQSDKKTSIEFIEDFKSRYKRSRLKSGVPQHYKITANIA